MDDLLCLMTAVIVADKRTFAEEIETFLAEMAKFQTLFQIQPEWCEAKLLMWYELNKDAVRQKALGPDLKSWLYERLNRLAHVEDKPAILESMRKVSIADGKIHVAERALMVLAARQWVLYPFGDGPSFGPQSP